MKIYRIKVLNEYDTYDYMYAHDERNIRAWVFKRLKDWDYIKDMYEFENSHDLITPMSYYDYICEYLQETDVWEYREVDMSELFIDERKEELV